MAKEEIIPFDVSEHLDSPEMIAGYLTACAEQGEKYLFAAIGDVAKAIGMTKIADASGLERNGLYRAFCTEATNTHYKTVSRVLQAIGLRLEVRVPEQRANPPYPD